MELAFESKSLRSICENEADAEQELGSAVAEALKHRLADLRAATSIHDVVVGNPRPLSTVGTPCLILDLCDNYYIIVEANHPNNPLTEEGEFDWAMISRLKVTQIRSSNEQD